MRIVLCCLAAILLAAPIASAGAKEKANKTKCSNALRTMEAVADRAIQKMAVRATAHLEAIRTLREAGLTDAADRLAANVLRQVDHHAEQAVDAINAIADACIAAFGDEDSDGDGIGDLDAARERQYRRVLISRRTVRRKLGD